MQRAKRADDELTVVLRYAHGYAWRRRMSRQLGVVLGETGRDELRGACGPLAVLAEHIPQSAPAAEALVDRLRRAAELGDANPAERVAGRLAAHVADPAVAGALRLRRGIQLAGVFSCVTEHRDLLDCACLRQLLAERDAAEVQAVLRAALDEYVAPVNGVWPALTN